MSSTSPRFPQTISHEEFADLFQESKVVKTEDRGSSIIHLVAHPQRGPLVLSSSCADDFCTLHVG